MDLVRTDIDGDNERRLFRKVSWRILPMLCVCYVFSFLDRTNVGYAQLQMRDELGFSDAVFGLGVSVFFIGYALFEVPSNMLLSRIGVRKTFLRILILWGLASAAMIFVETPTQFYFMRFLVGVFEAGFVPGVLYYLTLWFPKRRIAQATAIFYMSYTLAPILAGPAAGAIMTWLDGALQLHGWQWLYLLEGLPCVPLGIMAYLLLSESPKEARWLTERERTELEQMLSQDRAGHGHARMRDAIFDPRVWMLGLIVFLVVFGVFALSFWKPTLLKGMGLTVMQVGLAATIPALFGVTAAILVGRHSDKTGERRWHFAIAAMVGAVGMLSASVFPHDPVMTIVCLTLASIGMSSAYAVFWAMPATILSGPSAAAGIAVITTIGSSSGAVAPLLVGALKTLTGGFTASLYVLSGALACAAVIFAYYFRDGAGARRVESPASHTSVA
ncbi:MFS transporter [Cupriavidus sp. CP313]